MGHRRHARSTSARRTIDQAARDTANLAHAFEENTERIVAGGDQILLALRAAYVRDGPAFNLRRWVGGGERAGLAHRADRDHRRRTACRWRARPRPSRSASPTASISSRSGTRSEDRLFISRPVLGRSSGRWTIQLTRKIISPSGAFAGIVVLSVDCYELSGFYQSLNLQMGYIALFGTDGVIRARGPVVDGMIGSTIETAGAPAEVLREPNGTIRAQGKLRHADHQLPPARRPIRWP